MNDHNEPFPEAGPDGDGAGLSADVLSGLADLDVSSQFGEPIRLEGLDPGGFGLGAAERDERAVPDDESALDDLADDVVEVLRAVKDTQQATAALRQSLDRLEQNQASMNSELANFRREVAGARQWQANRRVFDLLSPMADDLAVARDSLLVHDSATALWLGSLLSTLRRTILDLGFAPFTAAVGEPFDAVRMECLDYTAGEPGVVLDVRRVGYLADGVVVRPCGVAVADPSAPPATVAEAVDTGDGAPAEVVGQPAGTDIPQRATSLEE